MISAGMRVRIDSAEMLEDLLAFFASDPSANVRQVSRDELEVSLLGSYSASVDVQKESADLVFSGKLPVNLLISHRVPLDKIEFAFRLATHPGEFPGENPLKIIVRPQELAD